MQQDLAERLLHVLAQQMVMKRRTIDEALPKLRQRLLVDTKPKKGMKTLSDALDKLEASRAYSFGDMLTSKEELAKRVAATEQEIDVGGAFRHGVRERFAAELIARFDTQYLHHCGAPLGGSPSAAEHHRLNCIYRPLACVNEGCVAMFSARAETEHDRVCGWKPLPCRLGCGAIIRRRAMVEHVEGPCPNRPVECPFKHIGCNAPGLTVGTLEHHLSVDGPQHLLLAVARIEEGRNVALAQATAVVQLKGELERTRTELDGVLAEREALKKMVRDLEHETKKDLKFASGVAAKESKRVDDALLRLNKEVAQREKATEVTKLRDSHDRLWKRVDDMARQLSTTLGQ